jgi:hypothetical protein
MSRRPTVTIWASRRRSRRSTCSGCSTAATSAIPRASATTLSSCWSHAWPAIDRGRRGCSWTTSLGRRADRLARQGVPRRRDAAARRCRGGVERLPAPGPPSDRRTARCKCGRACRCGCECRTLPRPSPTRTRRSSPTVARNSGISRRSSGAREAAAPVRPSPLATDPRWHRTPRFPPCPGPELQPVCPWQRMVCS